ncbi:Acylphosphatase-domain-containing protein [Lentinus tigrinus ALCF2SS1-6]|uniref:Acylphosphatase n=1 Tax=Lentinus tigrinus ALCF2SS1-6 TaxID=1328759 RepID=A0A5C2S1T9_9APHY|nr:Acylphosphatase-domain-containing protein [Lentinus tigrinus ALCF2SS1-6]
MTFHTVDYRVKGKVQGVFFRAFTKDRAQQHGLVGWVKNEPSGDVVGTAQGRREALEKLASEGSPACESHWRGVHERGAPRSTTVPSV